MPCVARALCNYGVINNAGFFLLLFLLSGPTAVCQCPQRAVALTLPAKRAEQSGARPAALETAGPGAEEVRV